MTTKPLPPIGPLRQRLKYDPETGSIVWLHSPDHEDWWNTRHVGMEAGHALNGYRAIKIYGLIYLSHRIAWGLHYGEDPQATIDHINGNRSDNRMANLRLIPFREQMKNRCLQRNSPSGFSGISKAKNGKWVAKIKSDKILIHLGTFMTLDEAVSVRKSAEARYGFHPNHGRVYPHG